MRLLLDQDVYASTARFLSGLGHDVLPVAQIGLARASDEELLQVAQKEKRLLVTRDRDYGHLVFVKGICSGVLYLRMLPATQDAVHGELERVLKTYTEQDLRRMFVVIEAGGHRLRRLAAIGRDDW